MKHWRTQRILLLVSAHICTFRIATIGIRVFLSWIVVCGVFIQYKFGVGPMLELFGVFWERHITAVLPLHFPRRSWVRILVVPGRLECNSRSDFPCHVGARTCNMGRGCGDCIQYEVGANPMLELLLIFWQILLPTSKQISLSI